MGFNRAGNRPAPPTLNLEQLMLFRAFKSMHHCSIRVGSTSSARELTKVNKSYLFLFSHLPTGEVNNWYLIVALIAAHNTLQTLSGAVSPSKEKPMEIDNRATPDIIAVV